MANATLPTLFVPHGGGPCFFMDWTPPEMWTRMADWLRGVAGAIGARPTAIVVVSAHWEEPVFTVNADACQPLLYDYFGFPEHTYRLTYPAVGAPAVGERVLDLLSKAGLASGMENRRGLDHGVFIPFKLIYPAADVPIVQLSLRNGLDPVEHLAAGRALAPLRDEGVLIVGSGMSFHNMRRFRWDGSALDAESERFDAWLDHAVSQTSRAERDELLAGWSRAPGGREAHPREEHLLPLHVVAGADLDDSGRVAFRDQVLGSVQSAFSFGRFGSPSGA